MPGARTGIEAAVTLAMGRALGESIAVAMVIGNAYVIPHSLLAPGATLGSAIINNFGGVTPGLDRSRGDRPGGDPAGHHGPGERRRPAAAAAAGPAGGGLTMSTVPMQTAPAPARRGRRAARAGGELIRAQSARSLGPAASGGPGGGGAVRGGGGHLAGPARRPGRLHDVAGYPRSVGRLLHQESRRRRGSPGAGSPTPSWEA